MTTYGKQIRHAVGFFLVAALLCFPHFSQAASLKPSVPVQKTSFSEYVRTKDAFSSALVIDAASGKVLYEYQADVPWPAASLTKLMGALVFVKRNPAWNALVALSQKDEVGGGRLRVNSGAKMSVRDLLYSSITASANNAAMAIARVSGLSMSAFVKAMNQQAAKMGLTHTRFVDASGMDPSNVTTAREMAILATAAFNEPNIRRAATTANYRFMIRNTGQWKEIRNTNQLLTSEAYEDFYVTGGKTGFLYESKHNLAVRVRPQDDADSRRVLMVIVFGASDTASLFKNAASLAKWAWTSYDWTP